MSNTTLYVLADTTHNIVRNFIQDLKNLDLQVRAVTEEEALGQLCDSPCHLIIIMSLTQSINNIRMIAQQGALNGVHLYFIGDPTTAFPNGGSFLNQIHGAHFPGLPVDMEQFAACIACNSREKKQVLVVDDDPIILRSVKIWLEDSFEITLVNSGEAALDFLNTHPIDLVLLDYRMPTMAGTEVLSAMRKNLRTKYVPVIFLTGRNDKESVIQVMQHKPDGYILKTKSPEEIKGAVLDFFKNRVANYGM